MTWKIATYESARLHDASENAHDILRRNQDSLRSMVLIEANRNGDSGSLDPGGGGVSGSGGKSTGPRTVPLAKLFGPGSIPIGIEPPPISGIIPSSSRTRPSRSLGLRLLLVDSRLVLARASQSCSAGRQL